MPRIDLELAAAGTPERAVQEKRYLKSNDVPYGARLPATRAIATTTLVASAVLRQVPLRMGEGRSLVTQTTHGNRELAAPGFGLDLAGRRR